MSRRELNPYCRSYIKEQDCLMITPEQEIGSTHHLLEISNDRNDPEVHLWAALQVRYHPPAPDLFRAALLTARMSPTVNKSTSLLKMTSSLCCSTRHLSYVWGDPKDKRMILDVGQPFNVTLNLANALKILVHSIEIFRMWDDAICLYLDKTSLAYFENH